ncbi:MliC family protein [Fodinicurvata sp. EGI_FJ10296]|uniref:MliC family protein n=1 Tax=Fodinicurvata sp. EGI_FJ10296 TaxID=3231908 RepID=UPI0034555CE4
MKVHGVPSATALSALIVTVALSACAGSAGDRQAPASRTAGTADPVGSDSVRDEQEGASQPPVVYACDGGLRLSVDFDGDRTTVTTERGADPLVLPQQPAGSGFRYATATHELRGQRRDAMWTVGRMMPIACTALRP